jgi:hypothetical protein
MSDIISIKFVSLSEDIYLFIQKNPPLFKGSQITQPESQLIQSIKK